MRGFCGAGNVPVLDLSMGRFPFGKVSELTYALFCMDVMLC